MFFAEVALLFGTVFLGYASRVLHSRLKNPG